MDFKALIEEQKKTTAALQKLQVTEEGESVKRARSSAELAADASRSKKMLEKHHAKIEKNNGETNGTGADPAAASTKEGKKDEQSRSNKSNNILSKGFEGLTKGFGKLSDTLGLKAVGTTFKSLLKFGLMGAALLAVTKFLQSKTWANLKDDIVPMLVKVTEIVISVIKFLFNALKTGFESVKSVIAGFTNDKGELDLLGGIKNLGTELDGLGLGIVGVVGTIVALKVALSPIKMFGKLLKAGKWVIVGTLKAAFKLLTGSLGLLAKGLKNLKIPKVPGVKETVKETSKLASTVAQGTTTGLAFTKGAASSGTKITQAASTIGKAGGYGANITKSVSGGGAGKSKKVIDIAKKFPKFAKFANNPIVKNAPFIGKIVTGGLLTSILLSGKSPKDMVPDIAGLFGGVAGAGLGALAGGAIGSAIFPAAGTVTLGILGSVIGAFSGDVLGKGLAEHMLGLPLSGVFGKGVRGAMATGKQLSKLSKGVFGFFKKKAPEVGISDAGPGPMSENASGQMAFSDAGAISGTRLTMTSKGGFTKKAVLTKEQELEKRLSQMPRKQYQSLDIQRKVDEQRDRLDKKVADADRALYQTNNQTINNSEKRIFHSAVSAKPDENEILMLGGVTQ